jgi:hypothetical protein
MASHWYRRIFPTRLSPERQAASEFETTAQGCRLATSIGGVLTGRGADLIILDDPLKLDRGGRSGLRPKIRIDFRMRSGYDLYADSLYGRIRWRRNGSTRWLAQPM